MLALAACAVAFGGAQVARVAGRPRKHEPPGHRAYGMVFVPAGTVTLAPSDGAGDDRRVALAAFEIDRTEVTVAEFDRCVRARACSRPDEGDSCNAGKGELADHPINCVDAAQAVAYCRWVGKRLPTDEEWEYAARGSDPRHYPWGDAGVAERACWARRAGQQGTCPVGSFPSGVSPFGALDMAGNVWEWTDSDHHPHPHGFRGGSWDDGDPATLRSAHREGNDPTDRYDSLGFRCAR